MRKNTRGSSDLLPHDKMRVVMKIKNLLMLAAVACAGTAMPAFAQHVTPANTTFTLSGLAQLTKPFPGGTTLTCNLTFDNTSTTGTPDGTGNANGGTLGEGSYTGDTGCPTLKVQTGPNFHVTGTVTSGVIWSGKLDHVVVPQGTHPNLGGLNLHFEHDHE